MVERNIERENNDFQWLFPRKIEIINTGLELTEELRKRVLTWWKPAPKTHFTFAQRIFENLFRRNFKAKERI